MLFNNYLIPTSFGKNFNTDKIGFDAACPKPHIEAFAITSEIS